MWYGQESSGNYDTGARTFGELKSKAFNLKGIENAFLDVYHWSNVEQDDDKCYIYISKNDGYSWEQLYESATYIAPWQHLRLNISMYCGYQNVRVKFYFDTIDNVGNGYRGWLIDDVKIFSSMLGTPIELISPDNQSVLYRGANSFSWNSLEESFGNVEYSFQISSEYDFADILTNINNITEQSTQTSISLSVLLTRGQYYWRVKGTYQNFNSKWSEIYSFTMKTPPESFKLGKNVTTEVDVDGKFTLNWTTANFAERYKVYWYSQYITEINQSVGDPIANITQLKLNISILTNGTYYFIIQAVNIDGTKLSNCIKVIVIITNPINSTSDSDGEDDGTGGPPDDPTSVIIITTIVIGVAGGGGSVGTVLILRWRKKRLIA